MSSTRMSCFCSAAGGPTASKASALGRRWFPVSVQGIENGRFVWPRRCGRSHSNHTAGAPAASVRLRYSSEVHDPASRFTVRKLIRTVVQNREISRLFRGSESLCFAIFSPPSYPFLPYCSSRDFGLMTLPDRLKSHIGIPAGGEILLFRCCFTRHNDEGQNPQEWLRYGIFGILFLRKNAGKEA